jgi:tRNA threonylcarbamoyl adenosine modification protein (Sua5/YciO/YrdC/YwlC family)
MRLAVDPERPYGRWLERAVGTLKEGGIVLIPSDSGYGLACSVLSHASIEKLRQVKELEAQKFLTLLFSDLKRIGEYAQLSDYAFKTIKRAIPGPYTFVLQATKKVPKLLDTNQRTVGIRIPDHPVTLAVLKESEEPLVHSSFPSGDALYTDPVEIENRMRKQLDLLLDVGILPVTPTTVVDLSQEPYMILRQGQGDASWIVGA